MNRCRWKSATISLFLSVLGFISLLPVLVEAHPKDFTILIEDPADGSPLGDRTPLILIHGIHGNQWPTDEDDVNNPFLYYWQTFRMFFYSWDKSGLKDKYKLYSFWYESDQISVDEISHGLRDWIDERTFQEPGTPEKLDDKPFVIVAHSMGGLVARAFMNQTLNVGQWAGHPGGERVIKLVTLGTPHHGSPGANDEDALEAYYASGVWDQIFSLSQFLYNVTSAASGSNWDVTFHSTQPNRSDLRWDGELWPLLPFDDNAWLRDLNENMSYELAQKIIAYYGYINPEREDRLYWEDPSNIISQLPFILWYGPHKKLTIASAVMDAGLGGIFPKNDGMVPVESGRLDYFDLYGSRELFDFDHAEMKGDDLNPTNTKYWQLFDLLEDDLNSLVFGISFEPSPAYAPAEVTLTATGIYSPDTTFDWEFHDGSLGAGQVVSLVYRQPDEYSVNVTAHDPQLGDILCTDTIEIRSPRINVHYEDDYTVSFTISGSPFIDSFEWDFGDGSDPDYGQNATHTYTENGQYQVTLNLILDEGPPIISTTYVYIGQGPTYVSGTINNDVVWRRGASPYIVSGLTISEGAMLTIEPGVTVKFNSGGKIWVFGTLDAEGVNFTWFNEDQPWCGIMFYNVASSASRLKDCTVEHANGNTWSSAPGVVICFHSSPTIEGCTIADCPASYGISCWDGQPVITGCTVSGFSNGYGIYVRDGSLPTISGCTISNNQYGIYILNDSSAIVHGNHIRDNTGYGIWVSYGENNSVFSGNTYSNNNLDVCAGGTINNEVTWGKGGDQAIQVSGLTIGESGKLTIEPGVTVKFNSGGKIWVFGTLDAEGVNFTWFNEDQPWCGIMFYNVASSASRLKDCTVEHANGNTWSSAPGVVICFYSSPTIEGCTIADCPASYGISCWDGQPVITGCTVSGFSNGYGIYVRDGSLPTISGCTISNNQYGIYILNDSSAIVHGNHIRDNTGYGIWVSYGENNSVFSGNTYSNNNLDVCAGGTINNEVTWGKGGDQAIQVSDLTIGESGKLTIEPGVTVKFNSGGKIWVFGTLDAEGVNFTWFNEDQPWCGIMFYNVASSASRLKDCTVEHANGNTWSSAPGVVICFYSSPTIEGCTIADCPASYGISCWDGQPVITGCTVSGFSNGYGIYVRDGSLPTISGCTISNNQYGIYILNDSSAIVHGNHIRDNTGYGIWVSYGENNSVFSGNTYSNNNLDVCAGGTINNEVTWGKGGDQAIQVSGLTIGESGKLTIEPGVTVKFNSGGKIWVFGTLDAEGVNFTWFNEDQPWCGIMFYSVASSASRLKDCTVEHANGNTWSSAPGVVICFHSSPTIEGCTIADCPASYGISCWDGQPVITGCTVSGFSNGYGIYVRDGSLPTISGCTISNNQYGIYILNDSSAIVHGNHIRDNTSYGIYHSGSTVIDATNNYWGDASGPLDDSDDRNTGGLYNPTGLGDRVSDHVNYFPWTGTIIGQTATPTGLSGTPGNRIICLDWNANTEPCLGGYKIYYGTSHGSYGVPEVVDNITSHKLTGLSNGTTYYIAISSMNTLGAESLLSDEITATPDVFEPLLRGDFDDDCDVDGSDLAIFASDFGRTDCDMGERCEGDFDADLDVDGADLAVFAANFGKTECPVCE